MKGRRLGGYLIAEELGKGGMGVVYKATQVELNRPVALKVLAPQFTVDKSFVERFRREAQAIARLNHPNIVQIYDIGEQDGSHFYAMELVAGETLDERIFRKERLQVKQAVAVMVQMLRGLQAAHEAGIVHRDVKPANVIVDANGQVKVMDFGIALLQTAERLTTTGGIVGTPEYMSPEQATGRQITAQSDIYSAGIVFYEMLTGTVPFENESPMATLQQHQYEEPKSPRELNPEIAEGLERIMLKMLAKRTEDRYATCAEVIDDLRVVLHGDPSMSSAATIFSTGARGVPVADARRGSRWGLWAALLAVAASAAALVVALRPSTPAVVPIAPAVQVQRLPDAEVIASLASVYEAATRNAAQRRRAVVHLANGAALRGTEGRIDGELAYLTVLGVGVVCFPQDALAPDAPLEEAAAAVDDASLVQESRRRAREFFANWKIENQEDFVERGQLPVVVRAAANALPDAPPVEHADLLHAVAEACAALPEARRALADAESRLDQLTTAAIDQQGQFADRVVLHSGRIIPCTIVDRESDFDALRVETAAGGRMSIPFAEIQYFERAYGQAATAAEVTRRELAARKAGVAAARAAIDDAEHAVAAAVARHREAVEALLAATAPEEEPEAVAAMMEPPAPPQPTEESAAAAETDAEEAEPVLWREDFTGASFADFAWHGWAVPEDCVYGVDIAVEDDALVIQTTAAQPVLDCPPGATLTGLQLRGVDRIGLDVRIDAPSRSERTPLLCWVEVEGLHVPPLAYRLFDVGPRPNGLPVGRLEPVPLIERDALRVPADGGWARVELPVAADWAANGEQGVVVTGLRLVHFHGDGPAAVFATGFDGLQAYESAAADGGARLPGAKTRR